MKPRLRGPLRLVALLSIVIALECSITQSNAQSFMGLGYLPGQSGSVALGVSDDGLTVVGSASSSGHSQAFRWTAQLGMIGLGDLPTGDTLSEANAVSSDGRVTVGFGTINNAGDANSRQAFSWTQSSGMMGLGYLAGSTYSRANAVSIDGSVVVGTSSGFGAGAFRWTQSTGMQSLGVLPGGTPGGSFAEGVSSDGTVVVGTSNSASGYQAYRWNASTGMVGLGDLPGGETRSQAWDVSANGEFVVGESGTVSGQVLAQEAFRWSAGEGMQSLGDLPGGAISSSAFAASGNGEVVVGRGYTAGGDTAFIWTPAGGMRSLKSVLTNDFGLNLSGWSLERATDISSDGSTIVGLGRHSNGVGEAFIAIIPEPNLLVPMVVFMLLQTIPNRVRRH